MRHSRNEVNMKKSQDRNRMGLILLAVSLALLFSVSGAYPVTMNDYCATPPFIVGGVLPNLLLMLDNSASQFDLQYINATGMFCYDNSYNNSNTCSVTTTTNCTSDSNCPSGEKCVSQYVGYYDPTKFYTSAGVAYATDITLNNNIFSQFTVYPGIPPSGCTFRTNYFCITTAGTTPDNVTQFVASGKFLNWLTASKIDVQKNILTGGKYDTTNKFLIGESRGCVGRRFVREIPDADWVSKPDNTNITFAVRSDISADPNLPSPGGNTRIDIFKSNSNTGFDNATCQAAVNCWASGGTGGCKSDSDACLNVTGAGGGARATLEHAYSRCWQCGANCCPENFNAGDIIPITDNNECGGLTDAQMAALKPSDAMYICLQAPDAPSPDGRFTGCTMNNYSGDVPGTPGEYIGVCHKADNSWDSTCVQYQFANYCRGLKIGEVVDPTTGPADTAQAGNIPANLVDGGVMGQLGAPIRTFHVRIFDSVPQGNCSSTATTGCTKSADCPAGEQCNPSGLIQQFKDQLRFGAMVFNQWGSKAPLECGNANSMIQYTCADPNNKDGAQIISYVGSGYCSASPATACTADVSCPSGEQCSQNVGSHDSGLIRAIDLVTPATWTPFSEAFYNAIGYFAQRSDLRINAGDFIIDAAHNPVQYRCQRNNVLIITDGMSTADLNQSVTGLVSSGSCGGSCNYTGQIDTGLNANIKYAGSRNLADLAAIAQRRKITDFGTTPVNGSDNISTFAVFSGTSNSFPDERNPKILMQDASATYGGGTFQSAQNPYALQAALSAAFQTIASGLSSGTAASVLASGEGSGANIIQALFYPKTATKFGTTEIKWIGSLQNLWYYLDPFLGNSTIREDTVQDKSLVLSSDNILHFRFDTASNQTVADLYTDSNGDGVADSSAGTKNFDSLNYLWEAGLLLHKRDPSTRTIYTFDGTSQITLPLTVSTASPLITLMNASNADEATAIAQYTYGTDLKVCSTNKNTCTSAANCTGTETCTPYRNRTVTYKGVTNTWKLGDIINSTPRIVSWVPLNNYHKTFLDNSYGQVGVNPNLNDPTDSTHFITSSSYKSRGMVFSGSNDGMLHAFKLGTLTLYNERYKKASLTGTNTGEEVWSFIPKNVLPYLKYLADPNYCHLYSVDATPYIFDASIGGGATASKTASSWRTVLIGGMRFGGACSNAASSLGVQTPSTDSGFSSYFALDITDPANPQVLWEFSDAVLPAVDRGLGFSFSGPTIIRIAAKKVDGVTPDNDKNGYWFAVFGSGPTGPIDTGAHQFKGFSNQPLKIYVIDLRKQASDAWAKGTNYWVLDSTSGNIPSIPYAFAGSMINAGIDFDKSNPGGEGFYQDEALYFGFTRAENDPPVASTKWNVGGVLRLLTKRSANPSQWVGSKVIEGIGPVTSAVSKLKNIPTDKIWLHFGTGRYFFKTASLTDDAQQSRSLYAVMEPCYSSGQIDTSCTTTRSRTNLGNVTSTSANASSDGWYIDLDTCSNDSGGPVACNDPTATYQTERVITDTVATSTGNVFFTTIQPTSDICAFGGRTHIWAVKFDTGGAVTKSSLVGKALIQVSTGEIKEIDLASAFTSKKDLNPASTKTVGYRRTDAIGGITSNNAFVPISQPKPLNKTIHSRER